MQVSFLYQNIFDTSFTHYLLSLWIAAIKQKNEYQKRKYIILYPLLLTLVIHTLNYSFFYTESPSNGDSTAETLNCVSLLKKTNPTS